MEHLLKTPLYSIYKNYGAKVVDFAGWALPIQFEGIIPEHHAVREAAGLFDVSHMGEIEVTGADSLIFLEHLVTNSIGKLQNGQIQYAILSNETGGIKDDVLLYRFSEQHFCVIVNAANRRKDFEWMLKHSKGYHVEVRDISDQVAQIALQGPKAEEILKAAAGDNAGKIRFFRFVESVKVNGIPCLISRTGYTGEDGFELYLKPDDAVPLWKSLLKTGIELGLKPCGLGCRDTLRFEACLPLYGQELSEEITPLEAGLGWVVKLDKPDFIGKQALAAQREKGIPRKLVGFELQERGIARSGYEIQKDGNQVGYVTTGYLSPTLGKSIGMALISSECSQPGEIIDIIIRRRAVKATIVETPFYSKKYKK